MRGPSTWALLALVLCVLFAAALHGQGLFLTALPSSVAPAVWLLLLLPALGLILRNTLLVLVFLPAIVVHLFARERLLNMRQMFQEEEEAWEELPVTTPDGLRIDAALWRASSTVPAEQQKWLIWCSANAVCFEEMMGPIVQNLGKALRCNVVLFNYGGVGNSANRWPRIAEDLYNDARAVYRAVLQQGGDADKILIYGHSLGSAIGAAVRRVSPSGPFCSDRSFSSLAATATCHVSGPNGFAIAAVAGVYLSIVHYWLMLCSWGTALPVGAGLTAFRVLGLAAQAWCLLSGWQRALILGYIGIDVAIVQLLLVVAGRPHLSAWLLSGAGTAAQHVLIGEVIGALFWASGGLQAVCPALMRAMGWEMDQVEAWKSFTGKKLLIHHPRDGIIPPSVSLYEALGKDSDRDSLSITLRRRWETLEEVNPLEAGQRYHNYEVASADPGQWVVLRQRIADLLK